jgi:hypothetical protein
MWFTLLSSVFSFLGGPVAKALVGAYQAHLTAVNADNVTAANLAGQEIAAQTAEINATTQLKIAEIGHPWEPEKLAMYITLVFYAKVMIWDKVLGSWTGGSTDPVGGAVGVWAGLIMSFYFGKRTFENVSRILKR